MTQNFKSAKNAKQSLTVHLTSVITNVLLTYIISVAMLFGIAVAITYSDFPESYSQATILVVTILSALIVGLLVAKGAKTNGWMWGALGSAVYMLLLYIIGSIVFGSFTFGIGFFVILIIALLAGAVGGVIGVNLRSRR